MATYSLNDHSPNQKCFNQKNSLLELRDQLYSELRQAKALISIASSEDFINSDKPTQFDYLQAIEGRILAALESYELLDTCLDKCK